MAARPGSLEEAFGSLARLEAAAWRAGDPILLREAAERCGALLDLDPLRPPARAAVRRVLTPVAPLPDRARRAALGFTRQFCLDVAALDEMTRVEMTEALGPVAFDFVQAVFVFDYTPRVRAALAALSDGTDGLAPDPAATEGVDPDAHGSLWEALDAFLGAVGRLRRLDPVTSELVRLRGARQHNCRLCQSLRSRAAIREGADDRLFGLVDRPAADDLSSRHRAALALTDAVIWHPARLDPRLVAEVRSELSADERTELVLDVMRNAANKIAVALHADAPHVASGVEIYDIDDDGRSVYGLSLP